MLEQRKFDFCKVISWSAFVMSIIAIVTFGIFVCMDYTTLNNLPSSVFGLEEGMSLIKETIFTSDSLHNNELKFLTAVGSLALSTLMVLIANIKDDEDEE